MFQYAAGRALSLRLGVPLGLDTHFFESSKIPLDLVHFNVQIAEVPHHLFPPRKDSELLKWLFWRAGFTKPSLLHEQGLAYNSAIEKATDGTYLIGYWQSERYFNDSCDAIRSDLSPIKPPSKFNAGILEELRGIDSAVSLHVRRGDYVKNAEASRIFGTCSMDYYERAVRTIAEHCETTPVVYAFSDDVDWVSENLKLPVPVRVVRNNMGKDSCEDIRLMSACRHHIIANSSFSWWGAWLNPSANKIVVAPSRWFRSRKYLNPDIWCKDWLRI